MNGDVGESRAIVPLAVAAAVAAVSTAAPVIRLAEPLAPEAIAGLRVAVTTLALLALGLARAGRGGLSSLRTLLASPRDRALTAVAGLCLAAHFAAWITSLSYTSVIRSVALVSTTPLFAGLLARVLGDRVSPRLYLGTLLAIGGTAIMVALDGPGAAGGAAWIGDLLALSGALTGAIYLLCGRSVQTRLGDALAMEDYFLGVNLVAGAALWILIAARGVELAPAGVEVGDYVAIVWLGLVPGLVGHGLFNWAVRRLPVHVVSLAALLEPVGSGLLAWVLLAQIPEAREVAGALVLITGVAVGMPKIRRIRRDPA